MTTLHLVYIHGFNGNDTSFQSFPKHLHERIAARIPQHNLHIESSLYPTYKSVKPISHAARNLLQWLSTQPPGPVILLAHSMGGLLAAEAVTDPSNNVSPQKLKRIIGLIAFDVPYLGMHPHVVVTGLASLFPKDDDSDGKIVKTEAAMNKHPHVKIVDQKVTDDWESFREQMHFNSRTAPYASDAQLSSNLPTPSTSISTFSLPPVSTSLHPRPSSFPFTFMDRTVSFLAARNGDDDPLVRWLRKHADEPLTAGKRWVVDHFQFGICMFDPAGLKARYTRLVDWERVGGLWVNYWTHTVTVAHASSQPTDPPPNNDLNDNYSGLYANGLLNQSDIDPKTLPKKVNKLKSERNFVIVPKGLGTFLGGAEKWEKVPIGGVEDEVSAHTGLFRPEQNLEYERLLEKVGDKILEWCNTLPI